jgi:hypothetical protein
VIHLHAPPEALLARLAELLHPIKPNLLQQDLLKIPILALPCARLLQLLIVGFEGIGETSRFGVGGERLGFEDESAAGEEGFVAAGEEEVETGVETVEVDPFGDGEAVSAERGRGSASAERAEREIKRTRR